MSIAKLRILLWKNWILQRRRPISGILQIAFPILIVVVIAWGKSLLQSNNYFYGNRFEGEFDLSNFSYCNHTFGAVFYYPQTEAYDRMLQNAFKNQEVEIRGFDNRTELDNEFWLNDEHDERARIFFSGTILVGLVKKTVVLNLFVV